VSGPRADAFVDRLRELGWIEGKTIQIDWRFTTDRPDVPLSAMAQELVALEVRAIVTALTPPLVAAAEATRTIPIVAAMPHQSLRDLGLIETLARPGGNITGIEEVEEAHAKLVELLKQAVPAMERVAYLRNPGTPGTARPMTFAQSAAGELGLGFVEVHARTPDDLPAVFESVAASGAQGLVVSGDRVFRSQSPSDPILVLPLTHRIPTIYSLVESYVANGGLMAYGPDATATHGRAADFVDKILKGADVATLPAERPTRFDFAVNVQTATALGISLAPYVASQVTQWIR
jgi:putative ABC transport system substrate-binding protein